MEILNFIRTPGDIGGTGVIGTGVTQDEKEVVVKKFDNTCYDIFVDGHLVRRFYDCTEGYMHHPRSGEAITWSE